MYKKEGITCILIPIRIITSKQLTTFMEHTLFLVTSILPGYITGATLITLYLNYDITEDFQTQFQQNSDAILSLIETLGTVDIPKKS